MASFRLNIARITSCPSPAELDEAMAEFGRPETEEYGVVSHHATDDVAFGTVARKTQTTVQQLDDDSGEVTASAVEKVTLYPFAIRPSTETLEIYAGPPSGIEQVGLFLASGLALPTVVEPRPLEIPTAIEKLAELTKRFQLRSARVGEYAHNSYMSGTYAPKFLDSDHGREFIEQYADFLKSAQVRFQGPSGRVNVTLSGACCYAYSCVEDDQVFAQSMLRKLG
jgi:hypothetical protein